MNITTTRSHIAETAQSLAIDKYLEYLKTSKI